MANTMNLWQRMSAVMNDVQYLKKDDSVGSGSYAYKAISEEKVTETVRLSLIKNGLVIFPIEQVHTQNDHVREQNKIVPISTLDVKYKIVNIDKPEEFEYLTGSGTGVDPQDKGVGKAATYAYKYMLLRTFAIPTGEDPDKIHNNDLDKKQAKEAAKTAPQQTQEQKQPVTQSQSESVPEQPKYATPKQKFDIETILKNPLITRAERSKMQLNINTILEADVPRIIEKMKATIKEREDEQSAAA